MDSGKNKRLAVNTVFLAGRTVLTLFINIFTTRVLMQALGVDDFGLFNVVAGFVTIFTFLQGAMQSASLRYLSYDLGTGDHVALRKTFASSLAIHMVLCGAVLLLAETLGLWFVNWHIEGVTATNRVAVNIVYQGAVVSMCAGIVQIPYSSLIMARERLGIYAVIMILQALFRLGIAGALLLFAAGRLGTYGILYGAASLLVTGLYMAVPLRIMPESRIFPRFSAKATWALLKFSVFDTYGNLCSVVLLQGANVVLNWFGGPVLNAASAIATQINGALITFCTTVVLPFKPQMTKEIAAADYSRTNSLIYNCGRYAFLLVASMAVPLFCQMDYILPLWLGDEVPEWAADFCRICVINACFETLNFASVAGIHATGKVMILSLGAGTLKLCELILAYFALNYFDLPPVVYLVHSLFIFLMVSLNMGILRHQIPGFSIGRFAVHSLLAPLTVAVFAMGACQVVSHLLACNFTSLLIVCALSAVVFGGLTLSVDRPAREMILSKLQHR